MATAFLMREYRSSGTFGAMPWERRMRTILLPATILTWGIPCESRRTTPICEGVKPFLAMEQISLTHSPALCLTQEGAVRLYGRDRRAMPFPLLCIRPMLSDCVSH